MANALRTAAGPRPAAAGHDDRRLLARCAQGDSSAFDELVAGHQERVANLVRRLLGWRDDIEDVVQDVFVAALQNLAKFRGEARLSTWLYRIAVNQCRRHRRRRFLRLRLWQPVTPAGIAASARPVDAEAGRCESLAEVRAAVAKLPPRDREVIVLRHLEELSIEALADVLRLRPNAVEVRLNRARARLKALLGQTAGVAP
jgi:RNA polymerase sigma-70 factor (ECF subfamily)